MMNITVLHSDIPAGAGFQCPVTAFIDVGSRHGQVVAVSRLDADGAAAVEAAFIDGNVAAEVKRQNPAGTETGLGGVARRELLQCDAPAGGELQHIGVAGNGGDGGLCHAGTPDGEVFKTPELQLGRCTAVFGIDAGPFVIGAAGFSGIVRRGRKVIGAGSQFNDGVGGKGGEKLIHRGNPDDILGIYRDFGVSGGSGTGRETAAEQHDQGEQSGKGSDSAFLIVHDLFQSFFQILFLRGEGGGDHAGGKGGTGRHVQKGIAVGLLFTAGHGAQKHLVTAELAGAVNLPPYHPGQGIEPVQGEYGNGHPLVQSILPTIMHQFMTEDIRKKFLVITTLRQDNSGMYNAIHQGRFQSAAEIQGGFPAGERAIDSADKDTRDPETGTKPPGKAQIGKDRAPKTEKRTEAPEGEPESRRVPAEAAKEGNEERWRRVYHLRGTSRFGDRQGG